MVWLGVLLGVPEPEELGSSGAARAFGAFFRDARGKDKFARALSYYSRFRSHTLAVSAADAAAFWSKLSSDLSMSRKTFKLFKWVADYHKAVDTLRAGSSGRPVRWVCEFVAAVLYVPYEAANNVLWLRSVGLIAKEGRIRSSAKDFSLRCRVVAAVARLTRALIDLREERASAADGPGSTSGGDDNGAGGDSGGLEAWRHPRRVALLWALAAAVGDMGVYSQRSGLVKAVAGVELSQGVVGACGVLGSVAGAVPIAVAACSAVRKCA